MSNLFLEEYFFDVSGLITTMILKNRFDFHRNCR